MWFGQFLAVGIAVVTSIGGTVPPTTLLTEADLPGWTAEAVPTADAVMPTRRLCGGSTLGSRARSSSGVPGGRVAFIQDPFTGPALAESVWSFPTPKVAETFLGAIRRAAVRCARAAHVDPVSGIRSTVTVRQSAPGLGDDGIRVEQRSTSSTSATTAGESIYVQSGDVVAVITVTGYAVDDTTVDRLAQQALDKLQPPLR